MLKLLISPRAEKDLEEIYTYTYLNWGDDQAEKYQDELFEAMNQILSNEDLGENYQHSIRNYRKLTINKHLLFYRTERSHGIIVRILHERMNLNTHL